MITPFRPQICDNAHQVTRLVFFSSSAVKWRRFAQGCAFWGLENKIYFDSICFLRPKKTEIWGQFLTGLKKCRLKKELTMGMLTCKLPLIVIVPPESCIVNRQIGVGNQDIWSLRPPIYRSHDPAKFWTKNRQHSDTVSVSLSWKVFEILPTAHDLNA